MTVIRLFICGVLVWCATGARAAELWVDGAAGDGGNGSVEKPFKTIKAAVAAMRGGDMITVHAGVYREEIVLDKSGSTEQPTTLRAAPGQRVVVSGFLPVTEWVKHRDAIYTAVVDGPVTDFFVGLQRQPISRWPRDSWVWRTVKDCDMAAGTFRDGEGLKGEDSLKAVEAKPGAARAYLYLSAGNFFRDAALKSLECAQGKIGLADVKMLEPLRSRGGRYQLLNHESLITQPGQWAFDPVDDKRTRLYFWPVRSEDLKQTQVPHLGRGRMIHVVTWKGKVSHVRIEGLEIEGSVGNALEINRAENVVVSGCIVHHNGAGISARRTAQIEIGRNIVVANNHGVSIASTQKASVHDIEIGFNLVDGLVIAGNVSGRPGLEPNTTDVEVRRNYIHHHIYLAHPDNMQTYRGVERLTLEDNVLLWGGQALMTEETEHGTLRNCVVLGTSAYAIIFGHGNSHDWTVESNTIGLGGWGAISFTGKDYRVTDNIFYGNSLGLSAEISSDYNLYALTDASQSMVVVSKPKWRRLASPAEVFGAIKQEEHGLCADAKLRNAPVRQAWIEWDNANTISRLMLKQSHEKTGATGFEVGDKVEINGDGVLRRITAAEGDAIRIEPPLPGVPFRGALIWNWKNVANCQLDTRLAEDSPARGSGRNGKDRGARLDIAAYQRGDFNGDGRRDLPELPDNLKASWPNPNNLVLPTTGF